MSLRKRRGGDDDLFEGPSPKKSRKTAKKSGRPPKKTPRKPAKKPADHRAAEFLEDLEEVPVADFEEQRRQGLKGFRYTRRILLVIPWALALSLVLNFFLAAAVVNAYLSPEEEVAQAEVQVTEIGRTQAESELQSWLDSSGSTFNGAVIASWDGVSDRREVAATDKAGAFTELTHNFTIRTKDGQYLRADIRIAYAGDRGAKVISDPTITPMRASAVDSWAPEASYSGWTDTAATDNLNSAVTSWFGALASDPNDLKLQVRDGDALRTYTTISGVKVNSVNIESVITPADDQGVGTDPGTVVATVSVGVHPEGAEDSDSNTTTIQYDVLVRGADTGAPYVTAWGPVGSGTTLKDYQNGIVLTSDDEQDQSFSNPSTGASDGGGDQTEAPADEEDE